MPRLAWHLPATSGSVFMYITIASQDDRLATSANRAAGVTPGTAEAMPPLPGTMTTLRPFATPNEGGRRGVPASHRRPQPPHDLSGILGMLPRQGPAYQDALHRLRQVQPRPTQGGVQRGDSLLPQPPVSSTGPVLRCPLRLSQMSSTRTGGKCRSSR